MPKFTRSIIVKYFLPTIRKSKELERICHYIVTNNVLAQ